MAEETSWNSGTAERKEGEGAAAPRNISDVLGLEASLAESSEQSLVITAKNNLLVYWKVYFVGQYRHAYEQLFVDLQEQGQADDLIAIDSFERKGDKKPLQSRASGSTGEFIADAIVAKEVLDEIVRSVQDGRSGLDVKSAPVKRKERAEAKARGYEKGLRALTDFARTSVICDSASGLKYVYDSLSQHPQVHDVAWVKNTFRGNYQANGYRDVKLILEVDMGEGFQGREYHTHLCEVQLHLQQLYCLKEGQHKVYEWARKLRVSHRMDPQHLFQGMAPDVLEEMIRLAREDWSGVKFAALEDLLTTAGHHKEAGELLEDRLNQAFWKLQDLIEGVEVDQPASVIIPSFLRAMNERANNHDEMGHHQKAATLRKDLLRMAEGRIGKGLSDMAGLYSSAAASALKEGDREHALKHIQTAVAMTEAQGSGHPELAMDLNNHAFILKEMGQLDEAERLHRRQCDILRQAEENGQPTLLYASSVSNLAVFLRSRGKGEEALYREVHQIREAILGQQHPDVAIALSHLAVFLRVEKAQHEEATDLSERAISILDAALEERGGLPDWGLAYANHATLLCQKGDLDGAYEHFEKAHALLSKVEPVPPTHVASIASIATSMAEHMVQKNKLEEAEKLLKKTESTMRMNMDAVPQAKWEIAAVLHNLAVVLGRQGKLGEAWQQLTEAESILRENIDAVPGAKCKLVAVLQELATVRLRQGKPVETEQELRKIDIVLSADMDAFPGAKQSLAAVLSNLASVLEHQGKFGEALETRERGFSIEQELFPLHHPRLRFSGSMLEGLRVKVHGR